jgi:carbon-monoxide dehydrogenase medium subunit
MKPAPFAYHDPASIDDAVALLARLDNARLLAGGQSVMPMLNMRFIQPDHLVDLNRVAGLAGVAAEPHAVRIGAMARQRTLEESADLAAVLPILREALAEVGHRQTRTRGTIGGSLCHLDPAAELVAVAMALDATLELRGAGGARLVPIADFAAGYMTPALAAGEMLAAVSLAVPPPGSGQCFLEFARRHGDFALASVAAILAPDGRGAIASAAIAVGAVAAVPFRLGAAEALLAGARPDREAFRAAAAEVASAEAMDDAQIPAWYRRRLAGVLVERALAKAAARMRPEARR